MWSRHRSHVSFLRNWQKKNNCHYWIFFDIDSYGLSIFSSQFSSLRSFTTGRRPLSIQFSSLCTLAFTIFYAKQESHCATTNFCRQNASVQASAFVTFIQLSFSQAYSGSSNNRKFTLRDMRQQCWQNLSKKMSAFWICGFVDLLGSH